jgi:hypothetical protein
MPPRTTAEAPGVAMSSATRRPPVSDSATASVNPRRVHSAMIAAPRTPTSDSDGDGTILSPGLDEVVDSRQHGEDERDRHRDDVDPDEPVAQE